MSDKFRLSDARKNHQKGMATHMEDKTDNEVPIYFRLPADLDKELRSMAKRDERTMAGQLRHMIRTEVLRRQAGEVRAIK